PPTHRPPPRQTPPPPRRPPPRQPAGGLDRVWPLTWTAYRTCLPGADLGFVSTVADGSGRGRRPNPPGTEPASKPRGLTLMAQDPWRGPPLWRTPDQAPVLLDQFRETADRWAGRSWPWPSWRTTSISCSAWRATRSPRRCSA